MTGSGRRGPRSRIKSSTDENDDDSLRSTKPNLKLRKDRSRDHSFSRIFNVNVKVFFLIRRLVNSAEVAQRPRVVTPFPAPKLMDLTQFQGDYFDPQSWIESDCEDFYSVSGDTTPSCGNTPVNHSSFIETPELDKPLDMDSTASSIPEPSKTDVKKQLIELFHESFRSDVVDANQNLQGRSKANPTIFHRPTKSTDKSRYECVPNSTCSIETTPNRNFNHGKRKLSKSAWCCLQNLGGSLSFVRGRRG